MRGSFSRCRDSEADDEACAFLPIIFSKLPAGVGRRRNDAIVASRADNAYDKGFQTRTIFMALIFAPIFHRHQPGRP